MIFRFKNTNILIIIIHIVIGYLCMNENFSKIYGYAIFVFGIISTIINRNGSQQAVLWAAYLASVEILLRMTGGNLFHEFGKYSVLLLLITGLILDSKKHKVHLGFFIYLFFLLIGIVFVDISEEEEIRKVVAFNLSGPFLLGISAIYFYNREINIIDLKKIFSFSLFPIVALASYLFFHTPDLANIEFISGSNFEASGGYGPNQVATALGFGIFALSMLILLKSTFSGYLLLDYSILIYFFYRIIITFSRGGLVASILAIVIMIFYFVISGKLHFSKLLKNTFLMAIIVFFSLSILIGNIGDMLIYRYTGKNSQGTEQEDITSGRIDFIAIELKGFIESPITGKGVGGSKEVRRGTTYEGATHNELTRLLVEHGMLGVIMIIMLFTIPFFYILKQPKASRGILFSFLIFWFLTINHSAMRMAFPGFIYGLSLIYINWNEEDSLYRE